MKKALLVASVASMIKMFNLDNISLLNELGYEVSVATNFEKPGGIPDVEGEKFKLMLQKNGIKTINICFERNPFSWKNLVAYNQIKNIMNSNKFDLIHCQSPVGGVITRISARKVRKKGTKVIYTAHGFHFYFGSSKKNWILYYPIEKILSRYTDTLITINNEDFERAKTFKANNVVKIPGVGIKVEDFKEVEENNKTRQFLEDLGISKSHFTILSVGELNENKNHQVIIKAMKVINDPTIHYILCGKGDKYSELVDLTKKLNLTKQVHFLGFREDVKSFYQTVDVFAFPSIREGLGIASLEAMSSGLPLLTSNVHGINDYSLNNITGFKYNPFDVNGFANGISRLKNMELADLKKISEYNKKIVEDYDKVIVNQKMKCIYSNQNEV